MEIGKKSSSGTKQAIIRMTNTDSSVQVVDTSLQQRMTASGSISGGTGSIQFILTDLRCADAASTYYCITLYSTDTTGSDEATTNITARTYPEQIEMFPSPDRFLYDDGQLISFRCIGRIGNLFDENNLQNLWAWEWRYIDNEFNSWTRYPDDQSITYDLPTLSTECQYTGASTLVHTISNLDNGRQFRCSVLSADFSANRTVYVLGQTPIATPSPPDTCPREQNQKSSIGVGVAVGVCIMVVVDVICLCVAYLFRDEIADCIGVKKTRNTNARVMSDMQTPPATVIAPVRIPTQGVGDENEVPENRNDYDVLQREVADVPNTYEKIRPYQNV
ncbi:uncharacterized protein [Haliotis asinina]|uniref:uncharacterized protein isoform X1 n=1 Tax=Haliotis asinina TaxID=109174 RepID=UPI0035321608